MDMDTAQQPAPPYDAAAGRSEIEAFFAQLAKSGSQKRLRHVTGVCQCNIARAGTWRVAIKEGVVTVTTDGAAMPPADCVISADAEDFICLLRRERNMNGYTAFMQELMAITGDLAFAHTVLGSFVLTPVAAEAC